MEIKIASGGGKKVVASYEGVSVTTDQSVESGGEASAPEPFDLFLASLATCAGHYVFSFCAKRDLPIEGITLTQSTVRDERTKLIEKVRLDIRLPRDFPEKYRESVIRSAGLCTVKKQLNPAIEFEITARPEGG